MHDVTKEIQVEVIQDMMDNRGAIVFDQMKLPKASRAVQLLAEAYVKMHPSADAEALCLDFESIGYAAISMLARANNAAEDKVDDLVEIFTKNSQN